MVNLEKIFDNQPTNVRYAVSYTMEYREPKINDDGTINDNPQIRVATCVDFYNDIESAKERMNIIPKITNRKYNNAQLHYR